MFLDTPLIASVHNRIIKESFEGVSIVNTDLPNTALTAAYAEAAYSVAVNAFTYGLSAILLQRQRDHGTIILSSSYPANTEAML